MALTERQRSRLRSVMDALLHADDVVMAIADERAIAGLTSEDEQLDSLHETLAGAIERLARLLGG
jgi:hypothetical protein